VKRFNQWLSIVAASIASTTVAHPQAMRCLTARNAGGFAWAAGS
jgi:hypothetical protein